MMNAPRLARARAVQSNHDVTAEHANFGSISSCRRNKLPAQPESFANLVDFSHSRSDYMKFCAQFIVLTALKAKKQIRLSCINANA